MSKLLKISLSLLCLQGVVCTVGIKLDTSWLIIASIVIGSIATAGFVLSIRKDLKP